MKRHDRLRATVAEGLAGYELGDVWQRAASSRVYEGHERGGTRRPVLVRVADLPVRRPADRRRFTDEVAAAAARATAGHTVRLVDSGLLPTGHPYLVTGYVPSTLADRVDRHGPVLPARAADYGTQVGLALDALHRGGTVHGAVTPRVVLLRAGQAKLDVFGVTAMTEPGEPVAVEGYLPLEYLAPEVVHMRRSTPATDVYSLAATLYGAVSGRPPRWPADRHPDLLEQLRMFDEPLPDVPGVPPSLTAVLRQAMSTEPELRQATMAELVEDLRRCHRATWQDYETGRHAAVAQALPAYEVGHPPVRGTHCRAYRAHERSGPRRPVTVTVGDHPVTTPRRAHGFDVEVAAAADRAAAGHTVGLYASGLLPDERHPYLVTEALPSLAALLAAAGPLPAAEVLARGVRIGRVLAAAHRAGTVHRHVTPDAVLLRADGSWVLDVFGVHTMVTAEEPGQVISPGSLRALLAYRSPEAVGAGWTPSGDLYSLAATLYGALAGRPPHWPDEGDLTLIEVFERVREPVPDPPGVPAGLCAVLRRALSFRPEDRQPDMDGLVEELLGVAAR
ncbi:serine/threonine-protein kinase [Virgisporangium ochraceum]|uniref:non-specific serine/threonine protein kinase n=1 Tax=Virgisporangium ochraceum TaxID=65505 RepID=A0A8J4EHU9_9ACTN|nr:protein kinase [Virgisporangium ochraceum]GIJ72567.1 hypothetical protein Voc01_074840 [Virgisporangium ochraceum]